MTVKPNLKHKGKADEALPRADTCFFHLELPDYSNEETCERMLSIAI